MNEVLRHRLTRLQRGSLGLGFGGMIGCGLCFFFFHQAFFYSYLHAFLFWFDLTLGCLLVAMLHHLTGGRWGFSARRINEAGFMTIPLMALLFVPLLCGLHELYPWTSHSSLGDTSLGSHKRLYLTTPLFLLRTGGIFMLWMVMGFLLRKWSLAQDETNSVAPTLRMRALSGPGIVLLALTITVAYVDWVMSTEPDWYSTIFAVIIMGGQVLCSLALSVICLAASQRFLPDAEAASELRFHQLGNLMLAFVMFWTYVSFSQLLIIWSGNLPREIGWYLHRIAGGWKWLIGVVVLFHFFLPFLLLLFRGAKRHAKTLALIACTILVAHAAFVYWMVVPSFYRTGFHVGWADFAAPIGIGGFWLAAFLQALKRGELFPRNDPRMILEVTHA